MVQESHSSLGFSRLWLIVGLLLIPSLFVLLTQQWWQALAGSVPLYLWLAIFARQRSVPGRQSPAHENETSLGALLRAVLPIWKDHVSLAREQSAAAASGLAATVALMSERLQHRLHCTYGHKQALAQAQAELPGIVKMFEESAVHREGFLVEVGELGGFACELQEVALEIARFTAQTQVVASAATGTALAGVLGGLSASAQAVSANLSANFRMMAQVMDKLTVRAEQMYRLEQRNQLALGAVTNQGLRELAVGVSQLEKQ